MICSDFFRSMLLSSCNIYVYIYLNTYTTQNQWPKLGNNDNVCKVSKLLSRKFLILKLSSVCLRKNYTVSVEIDV